ncbi:hypothetical protein [Paenibacillus alginolyticus]|uniref:Uncharacterized protein n=1 Tax=Paenibacillus alginolyticus TaxID=59839 RepID=A0ABT4G7N8_9BACL|nr:hypothetical protein [Paenibacillus alginolyticus]MCY9692154.1 hypothetical protein [Paenibacillus alginolyticus]
MMKKQSIYRYVPVCIFSALLVTIVYEIGYTYKWWILIDAIVPWGHVTNTAFAYGIFLVGTMWVFHFTFGRFWLYIVANLVLDAFYAFVFHRIEEKLGIADLICLKHYHILLLMVGLSLILYPYQLWQERARKNLDSGDHDDITIRINTPTWLTKREKAK